MVVSRPTSRRRAVRPEEADAVLAACRVLVAVSAQSIAAVEDVADLTQVRALVVLASHGPMSLGALAEATRINLSTSSRLCDRLVSKGLVHRADDPADRRQLTLSLTREGRQVVQTVMARRRMQIDVILARMPDRSREQLVSVLDDFAEAGGEPAHGDLWAMGWST